ncbi:MAG: UDP-N-acetylmuramate--L-alanine ligase [Nitrospirae bacterium]|nr:UDP-N-acetylmuramate--L-alanine ligase [Nitrospirota bacterium]
MKLYKTVHFVGIGGIGMSGIAEVLCNLGYSVTGSDISDGSSVERLRGLGVTINIGHRAENVMDAHVVVISSAVKEDNVEVIEAKRRLIPVIPRAEMLAEIGRLKYSILIAGSHGKTTTTSLISTILSHAGLDPTVVVGGKLNATGTNAMLGSGEFFVAEADESDGSFLKLNPTIAVVTNIDKEHMDHYSNMDELCCAFIAFMNKTPFFGTSIICLEDPYIREIIPLLSRRYITYGLSNEADYYAKNIKTGFMYSEYDLYYKDKYMVSIHLPLSGIHNVLNSIAAIAASLSVDIGFEEIKESIGQFRGIKRRCEFKGEVGGIKVFDDYGHHPTEIKMTLSGIKDRRRVVVFQPHRYSRTADLMDDFASVFIGEDKIFLMDIYSAGEKEIKGVNSKILSEMMLKKGVNVTYVQNSNEIPRLLKDECKSGDIVITFGAGDIWKIGERFVSEYTV